MLVRHTIKAVCSKSWRSGVVGHQRSGGLVGGRNTQQVTGAGAFGSHG